eukprot:3661238-Rhodomonas_salina.1
MGCQASLADSCQSLPVERSSALLECTCRQQKTHSDKEEEGKEGRKRDSIGRQFMLKTGAL